MPSSPKLSREQALDYLAKRGLLTKARESYTTAYAKRLASAYGRAEKTGRTPSRTAARGKAGPEHLVPNYARGPLRENERRDRFSEQYRISLPETVSDLKPLKLSVDRRRRTLGLGQVNPYTLVVQGLTRYRSPKNPEGELILQTLVMYLSAKDFAYWLKNHGNVPIVDFINRFWSPLKQSEEWEEIISIALKVRN